MSRDPAILFYDADAARDVSHMNRLERGCYFDLVMAQIKFGGYTAEQARKILGSNFNDCWGAIEMILSNEEGVFFIEWLRNSISKRRRHSDMQRERINKRWYPKSGNTTVLPANYLKANVIENEKEKKDGVQGKEKKFDFESIWARYPNKDGKKSAFVHFEASVKTDQDWKDINKALDNYLRSERVAKGFVKNGSTWFNNWKDWVNFSGIVSPEAKKNEWKDEFEKIERDYSIGKFDMKEKERLIDDLKKRFL